MVDMNQIQMCIASAKIKPSDISGIIFAIMFHQEKGWPGRCGGSTQHLFFL